MAQNYGYEFLMTELPTYMKQILRFSIKEVSRPISKNFSNFFSTFLSAATERISLICSLPWHVDLFDIAVNDR